MVVALWAGLAAGSCAATLMTFTQTVTSSQNVRFRDGGVGGSELTTLVNGQLGVAIDVSFTFLAANSLYAVNTTVAAKLTIHAVDAGAMVRLGPSGPRVIPLTGFTFSFTDPNTGVNFLSGSGDFAYLSQVGSTRGATFEMYDEDGLTFTSDAFNLSTSPTADSGLLLNLSNFQVGFTDSNSNSMLDTQSAASIGGSATADVLPVPEPGSALLVALSAFYAMSRRRRL